MRGSAVWQTSEGRHRVSTSNVLVLNHGAMIALGTPEAVVREPAVIESYLGAEAIA